MAIDYYFTCPSPFAYLGHQALHAVAEKHGVTINYKPFILAGVWENSGAVMPAQRPAVRQRYRLIELQRVALERGISLKPKPENFPADPTLGDHCVCALVQAGKDPAGFLFRIGEALWTHDRLISDEAVISELLEAEGHDAAAVIAASKGDAAINFRKKNTQDAVAADAVGAPAYVYKGEVFWGQDRIGMLDNMIASGRAAFTAE